LIQNTFIFKISECLCTLQTRVPINNPSPKICKP